MSEVAWITTAISVVMAIITAVSITRASMEKQISQVLSARLCSLEDVVGEQGRRLSLHDTAFAVSVENYKVIKESLAEMKDMLRDHLRLPVGVRP